MAKKSSTQLFGLITAGMLLLAYIYSVFTNHHEISGWLLMLFFVSLAITFRYFPALKGFSFTLIIFAAVSLAMYYPQYFVKVGNFKLSKLIIPLLQLIMFGMGSELSLPDLATVLKKPKGN